MLSNAAFLLAETSGKQTVPRVEVWAGALVLSAVEADTFEEIYIDGEYVTKAYEQSSILRARTNSRNGAICRCFMKEKERKSKRGKRR